jgi:hypothetical protein
MLRIKQKYPPCGRRQQLGQPLSCGHPGSERFARLTACGGSLATHFLIAGNTWDQASYRKVFNDIANHLQGLKTLISSFEDQQ